MKKTLYPKTRRITDQKTIITEKLDGSNLWIFKLNGEIVVAQRNHIYKLNEVDPKKCYKWLYGRLQENTLNLFEWSWVFGEWIGMGKIWYGETLEKKFYIFAKARIDETYTMTNLQYSDLEYAFDEATIPDCISKVPVIEETENNGDTKYLDLLYDKYTKEIWRRVEWFVVNTKWNVTKYVRCKNGKETAHIV